MKSMNIQTLLDLLEIDDTRDRDRIHRAYRRQVKRWHPDQFAHQPEMHALAEERLKKINYAYQHLILHIEKNAKHTDNKSNQATQTENTSTKPPPSNGHPSSPGWQWRKVWSRKPRNETRASKSSKAFHCKERPKDPHGTEEPSFARVLRKAAGPNPSPRKGVRVLPNARLRRKKRSGMRVDGFSPMKPVTPVRSISRIDGTD